MAEAKPANTIELGANAYLIKSPTSGTSDCLIIAHGGSIDLTQKFDVPAGLSIRFFASSGKSLKASDGVLKFIRSRMEKKDAGEALADENDRTMCYREKTACPDYILAKALGSHWEDPTGRASYTDVRKEMDSRNPGNGANWVPHIVTVRNRTSIFRNKNIWLSALVEQIMTANLGITTIYCASCRDDDTYKKDRLIKTVGKSRLGSRTMR